MQCPRCGREQPAAAECASCGVVVARWRPRAAAPAPSRPSPAAPTGSRRSLATDAVLLLLLAAATPWALARWRRAESVEPPVPAGSAPRARVAAAKPGAPVAQQPSTEPVEEGPAEATAPCPLFDGAEPAVPTRWPIASRWHEGAHGFRTGEQEQRDSRAPMLVYFFTDWCGYCRSFEREVLSDREVEASLGGRVIRVRLNPEVGAEEDSVAMRYGVKGYPSLFLVVPGAEPVRASTTVNGEEVGPPSEFLARLDAKIASAAKRRLAAGRERFQAGDTAGAVEALGDAIGLAPADAALYYERGTIHHRSGDPVRAFEDFRAALGLDPGYAAPISFLARALGEEGRWEEAVTCWNRRLEQAPSDPVAFYERSRAHYNRRDRVRARADLEQSCRLGEQQACRLLARI